MARLLGFWIFWSYGCCFHNILVGIEKKLAQLSNDEQEIRTWHGKS